MQITVRRLDHNRDLPLPRYETSGAAGMDLLAAVTADVVLQPGARAIIPTGLQMAIPEGFEVQVRPRSGLAAKNGVTVLNSPGTIDSDYRGEVSVVLINHGDDEFTVTRGMRIAQIVIASVSQAIVEERMSAGQTTRGSGGYGSTGTR